MAPVTTRWLVGMSAFWFATSYKWFLMLVFLLPGQVAAIVPGGEKSAYWGAVFGTGAVWAVIGPALFGDFSDRFGDRRPFLLAGSVLTLGALFALHSASAIWMLALGYLLLQFSDDVSTGPYSAIVPELVPEEQRGRASGIIGAAMSLSQVGAVLAVLLLSGNRTGLYISIAVLNVATALYGARLIGAGERRKASISFVQGWLSPWKSRDFRVVWLTRFLATLGFYLVIPYANFYVRDMLVRPALFGIEIGSVETATAVLALTMAVAGAAAAILTGPLTDSWGRKRVTWLSALVMASGFAAMISLPGFSAIWTFVILVGAGYGGFQTANWAMVSDVLPERTGLGRDMGIWQMSISSVQIIAGGAGIVVTQGNAARLGLGYQILFALAAAAVFAGGLASLRVRASR